MLRRSAVYRVITNPDLHRHAAGTFKDGHHRAAPQPGLRAWVDPKSPYYRLTEWSTLPASKASLVIAWSTCFIVSYYCFCVSYDLRGVYAQNHKIQRQLHIAHARAEDADARIKNLRQEKLEEPAGDEVALTHEMELTRERSRSAGLLERNQMLVKELTEARAGLAQIKSEKKAADEELAKFRALMKRLDI